MLLFDEVELIGKYSRLQRARSYAELTRWLGVVESERYPGLLSVATITDDFASAVLMGKQDIDHIGPFLESKGTDVYQEMAGRAVTGMRIISRDALLLHPPSDESLQQTHDVLRGMYATAYGWEPSIARCYPRIARQAYAVVCTPLDQRMGPGTSLPGRDARNRRDRDAYGLYREC